MTDLYSSNIQLGFDIATSVTIIGALASWWWESRRRSKQALKEGMLEQVRSTSLEKTLKIVEEFEDSFSGMVISSQSFSDDLMNGKSGQEAADYIAAKLNSGSVLVKDKVEQANKYLAIADGYYETIQKRRYSLLPILETIDVNNDFLLSFKNDIVGLGELIQDSRHKYVALLSDLEEMSKYIINQKSENSKADGEDQGPKVDQHLMSSTYDLILNEEYSHFVRMYLEGETQAEYIECMDGKLMLPDTLIKSVLQTFLGTFISDQDYVQTQLLMQITNRVIELRQKSKSILIKLSALSYVLLSNQENEDINTVVKRFESEEYLSMSGHIR